MEMVYVDCRKNPGRKYKMTDTRLSKEEPSKQIIPEENTSGSIKQ